MTLTAHLVKCIQRRSFLGTLSQKLIDILHVASFYHTMFEEYALYSVETVIYQYLQLILQCYFNGHAVALLVVAVGFLITGFWLAVTSWDFFPYVGSVKMKCNPTN